MAGRRKGAFERMVAGGVKVAGEKMASVKIRKIEAAKKMVGEE